jgi:hypothetical protein
MANPDAVGQNLQDNFGTYRLSISRPVLLSATSNAVAILPILSGGLGGSGSYIIRRITVSNLSNSAGGTAPSAATANVTVGTSNDGANLITGTVTLTNLTSASTYVDITPTNAANATYNASVLFVNVTANVANAQCQIAVYGDMVSF